MTQDHLDRETNVSAEITESGVKAGTNSRFIAAIDRLGGALVEQVNTRLEASNNLRVVKSKGEEKLIEAVIEYGVKQLGVSSEFAERAFNKHFEGIIRGQKNKDSVLLEAKKDLELNPPQKDIAGEVSEEFFSRFETYAASASSENLRVLFGRILAGEIRQPGTISSATLHFANMLDVETAKLIEKYAPCVDGAIAMLDLVSEKYEYEIAMLESAGFWVPDKHWNPEIKVDDGSGTMLLDDGAVLLKIYSNKNIKLSLSASILTRAGREILMSLGRRFDLVKDLSNTILKVEGVTRVDGYKTFLAPDGNLKYSPAAPVFSTAAL